MAIQKKEENVNNFDFIQPELDYILANAHFTKDQEKVFNRLTDREGRQTIVKISMEENMSTAKVNRIIRQIKFKIFRLL